jgi:hypothetical protein
MKNGAAHSEAGAGSEIGGGGHAPAEKSDAAERDGLAGRDCYAELRDGGNGVGHEAFSTGFIDGRALGVGYGDGETEASRGEGGG